MKRSILFLLALGVGLSLANAAVSAFEGSIFGLSDSPAPSERAVTPDDHAQGGPQALCRQVEVQLDEGYGVRRRETRVLCQDNP